jgi:hypothetical protein
MRDSCMQLEPFFERLDLLHLFAMQRRQTILVFFIAAIPRTCTPASCFSR